MIKIKNKTAGFTLVELIIAIVILSIAIGTLLGIIANVQRQTVLPEIMNVATHLAERELERVSVLRFSAVASQAATNFGGNFSDYTSQIIVSAVPVALASDAGQVNYKQVEVAIGHPSFSGGTKISLTTIVTNN